MDPLTLATTATSFLSPYLVDARREATENIGDKLPEVVGKVWNAIMPRFTGQPAAEEAVKDLVARPDDQLTQAAFANQIRKVLESEPAFADELEHLLTSAQIESSGIVTGIEIGTVEGGSTVIGIEIDTAEVSGDLSGIELADIEPDKPWPRDA